MTDPMTLYHR